MDGLHLFHAFSTFAPGGPQLRIIQIMRALGPSWSHTIMAMDRNFEAANRIQDLTNIQLCEPPKKGSSTLYPLAIHNTLKRAHPDVLITYNWGAIEAVAGGLIGSVCPIIHHEHGFGADEAAGPKRRRALARRVLLNRIYKTIVPSKTLLDIALSTYKVRPEKVTLIRNGTDVERFRPQRNQTLRSQLGLGDGDVLFGYVGHLRPEKNLELLIRAFVAAQIQGAKLILIGDGNCREALQAVAKSLGAENRIVFAGSSPDTVPYYAAMDVFVLSSVTEQMPMSLLEAMASALPALCTDVGDVAEMLGNPGAPAVVPSENLEAYVSSLKALASGAELRRRLGARNRERCIAEYSLEKMVRLYEKEYRAAHASSGKHQTYVKRAGT
ncbi:MAG TPA: glycosyltransferase family 4 protein [Terriglobales bacterium]|nr:glycosyltransferase family 4 protein [Terriglobales bacterium]